LEIFCFIFCNKQILTQNMLFVIEISNGSLSSKSGLAWRRVMHAIKQILLTNSDTPFLKLLTLWYPLLRCSCVKMNALLIPVKSVNSLVSFVASSDGSSSYDPFAGFPNLGITIW